MCVRLAERTQGVSAVGAKPERLLRKERVEV